VAVAGALLGVAEHRPEQRADIDISLLAHPRQQIGVLDQSHQVGRQHRRQLQGMAVGELAEELAQRRWRVHPPNSRRIPPERITSKSSMVSASAAIPARIEVNFPAGFTPAEATLVDLIATRCSISSDSPARSANPINGTIARARHEILVIEDRGGPRPDIR
jgi:hypothetical protein